MNVRGFSWALLLFINLILYYAIPTTRIINSPDGITKNVGYSLISSAVIYFVLCAIIILASYKRGIEYYKKLNG
jgi:hypothetical protein